MAYAPFKQTDELVNEIINLKVKYNNNGSLGIERVVNNIDKDRYTSLAYGVWWIMEFDNQANSEDGTMSQFFKKVNRNAITGGSPTRLIKKIFR